MAPGMKPLRRILLIEPPVTRPENFSASRVRVSPFFPLGLGYLAAVLERQGYEVEILDALLEGFPRGERAWNRGMLRYGLLDEEIQRRMEDFRPDLVGVSAIFSAKDFDAKNLCRLSKAILSRVPTVLGGPHAGSMHREILEEEPSVDYVLTGEAEESLPALLEALKRGAVPRGIDGLAYREGGRVISEPKTRYIDDLDLLPFPARHKVNMEAYLSLAVAHDRFSQRPFTQVLTSRGCPYRCAFCALGNHWGRRLRQRSADNVLQEIDHLVETYGIREIHFEDDNLAARRARALALCKGLEERRYGLTWTVPTGMAVATLDEELIAQMAKSGCTSVTLAIESGDQRVVSKLMHKPVNLKKVPRLVQAIRDNGMLAKGFFMLGYPGETRETIQRTVAYARDLRLDWTFFFIATPLPKTEMFWTALHQGYIRAGDFNPLTSLHESVIRTPEFDQTYLQEVREKAIIDLNFRGNPNMTPGRVHQAIADFTHVLGLYPHFDFAHLALGDAFRIAGRQEEACRQWQAALSHNPDNTEAAERLRTWCTGG